MTTEIERASARPAELCLPLRLKKPRLNCPEAVEYLREVHGVRVAPATMNKYRCIGGGPLFEKFGATVLYKPGNLDAWALDKLGEPKSSTSDEARS
jgi:hypothetical protein